MHSNDENAVEVYARLQTEGRLPVRVYLTLPHDELDKEQPAAGKTGGGTVTGGGDAGKPKPWSGDGGLLSWNRVKLFSDGSLGAFAASSRLRHWPERAEHQNQANMRTKGLAVVSLFHACRWYQPPLFVRSSCGAQSILETHEAVTRWQRSRFCLLVSL